MNMRGHYLNSMDIHSEFRVTDLKKPFVADFSFWFNTFNETHIDQRICSDCTELHVLLALVFPVATKFELGKDLAELGIFCTDKDIMPLKFALCKFQNHTFRKGTLQFKK